jgi:hypothetical protein
VVTKIGGVVLDQIDELALSLPFLYRVSLSSLIYGAGPQLNEIRELEGVIPDYVQGICVDADSESADEGAERKSASARARARARREQRERERGRDVNSENVNAGVM